MQRIYDTVEGREERYELNLYITGYDEQDDAGRDRPSPPQPRRATAARASPPPPETEGSAS